jgi:hypothetical protein
MAQFRMEIAGQVACVTCLFDSTPAYFRSYLTEKEPDFSITVRPSDLEFEQADALEEALREGFRPRVFTDPFLERAAIQRQFAEYLFDHDTLLFHGSVIAVDGMGYLFAAKSGTGKSTHTRLWREHFGNRAVMVNDDKPFLKIRSDGVWVCGSPWSGKHGLDTNITVPLKSICILERGPENRIRPMEAKDAMPRLLHEGYCPVNPDKQDAFHAMVNRLADSVPLWHMECNKNPDAAVTAYDTMSR